MTAQLPSDVIGTAVGVLVYSIICLLSSCVLIWLTWAHHERTSYVSLLACFASLASTASVAQQIHTFLRWKEIKLEQYEYSVAHVGEPEIAISGASVGLDLILFYIQFYCYNVLALLVLFWACALAQSIFQIDLLKSFKRQGSIAAKLFAVFFPVLQVSLLRTTTIRHDRWAFLTIANMIMAFGLTLGSCLLMAILLRYIQTRRAFLSWNVRYGESDNSHATTGKAPTVSSTGLPTKKRIYDRWLVLRFTVAFVALGIFQVVTIMFEVVSMRNNRTDYLSDSANLSDSRARSDFIIFIPGVSASLLTFFVFGTTKTFREYMWYKLVPRAVRRRVEKRGSSALVTTPPMASRLDLGGAELQTYAVNQGDVETGAHAGPRDDAHYHERDMGPYTPTSNGGGIRLRDSEMGVTGRDDESLIFFTAQAGKS